MEMPVFRNLEFCTHSKNFKFIYRKKGSKVIFLCIELRDYFSEKFRKNISFRTRERMNYVGPNFHMLKFNLEKRKFDLKLTQITIDLTLKSEHEKIRS